MAAEHQYALQDEEALRWATEDMCPMHFAPEQAATAALNNLRAGTLITDTASAAAAINTRSYATSQRRPTQPTW